MRHLLVFSTVILTIGSSLVLDAAAEHRTTINLFIAGLIGLALALNILKFGLWGWIHRNYDISKSYPLTSIFFPLIFIISYWKGEVEITGLKLIGIALVVVGLWVFERQKTITS